MTAAPSTHADNSHLPPDDFPPRDVDHVPHAAPSSNPASSPLNRLIERYSASYPSLS